jgi:hypothetical protein
LPSWSQFAEITSDILPLDQPANDIYVRFKLSTIVRLEQCVVSCI